MAPPACWAARIGLGRADGDHQDPPVAGLLYRRTAHPLGTPPHPASSPAMALGNPVQSYPGPIARPATPVLTAASATGPPTSPSPTNQPNVSQHLAPDRPASVSCYALSLGERLDTTTADRPLTPTVQNLPGQSLLHVPCPPFHRRRHSVRWIRAKVRDYTRDPRHNPRRVIIDKPVPLVRCSAPNR